jgi:hypothetical protein
MDVPEFERGSTRIAWECLSTREQKVFDRLEELRKEYGDGFGVTKEVLAENREILDKGIDILFRRAFDLFLSVVGPFLGEDKFYESIFAVACMHALHDFNFELLRSGNYCRSFFDQLDDREKKVLLDYLSDFASQPFIKIERVSPELLAKACMQLSRVIKKYGYQELVTKLPNYQVPDVHRQESKKQTEEENLKKDSVSSSSGSKNEKNEEKNAPILRELGSLGNYRRQAFLHLEKDSAF